MNNHKSNIFTFQRIQQHQEENALLKAYIGEWRKFYVQSLYFPEPFRSLENMAASTSGPVQAAAAGQGAGGTGTGAAPGAAGSTRSPQPHVRSYAGAASRSAANAMPGPAGANSKQPAMEESTVRRVSTLNFF